MRSILSTCNNGKAQHGGETEHTSKFSASALIVLQVLKELLYAQTLACHVLVQQNWLPIHLESNIAKQ